MRGVDRPSYGTVTALWNLGYDAGLGVGAAGFGLAAGHTGYPWTFALTAAAVLPAPGPAARNASCGRVTAEAAVTSGRRPR
ncbi:hypothetical protein [Streptomyces sp. NPDC051636]|uniref:hypothetical protein n=1 Tax=Streptomyces sp. NPDC051636 TaxID=3365663 RepID=UPI003787D262